MDRLEKYLVEERNQKIEKYRILNRNVIKGKILFTGSSLMEFFPIQEMLLTYGMKDIIYNRAVAGFRTADMLENMEEMVFGTNPSKIFINIGTNDISMVDYTLDGLLKNYKEILSQIKRRLPDTEVYMMAYYPVNEEDFPAEDDPDRFLSRNNYNIRIANEALKQLAAEMGYHFINGNDGLCDERGMLKKEFTIEGIHMYGNAYEVVLNNIKSYFQ